MILVFDVGNTETTAGLFAAGAGDTPAGSGQGMRGHWRVMTSIERTPDEFALLLRGLLATSSVETGQVTGTAIGSVVPAVTGPLVEACRQCFGGEAIVVDARARLPITLDVDEPLTVGADRIINTLAVNRLYGRDAIVVDLGTATTYDCITADGVFLGGVIQPGVRTSAETLFRRTSKLPATEIQPPERAIGRRTEECIRAGIVYGAADSIDGIVRRIKAEWPRPGEPMVIGTGGLAESLQPFCKEIDEVDPYLTLRGLRLAHELLAARA